MHAAALYFLSAVCKTLRRSGVLSEFAYSSSFCFTFFVAKNKIPPESQNLSIFNRSFIHFLFRLCLMWSAGAIRMLKVPS